MRRLLVAAGLVGAFVSMQVSSAGATTDPSPCPTSTASSGSRVTCPAPTDPNQAAYDSLKARLGGDVARALAAQQRLRRTLDQFAGIEQSLTAEVMQEEAVVSQLEEQIAALEGEIADTQERIDTEKQELATMSRAIYREPDSFWMLIARTGNLHDALIATADAVVAGQRAHALQDRLEQDLEKLQADRDARQADLDRESNTLALLNANLSSLQEVIGEQGIVSSSLASLMAQLNSAKAHLQNVPPDVTATLAQLLEAQEQDLILRSYQTAWTQAQVGTGLALVNKQLPVGKTIAGLALSWPMNAFRITQPFGPSNVTLEPPFGPYKHFHTGVDIAAPLGTPVMAAAEGIVVAVGHTTSGYGNYVIIAHGGGIATLYGHLLATKANYGDRVVRGQLIGLEGSTGFSTGPHVHFELRVDNLAIDPMPYLPIPGTTWSGQ